MTSVPILNANVKKITSTTNHFELERDGFKVTMKKIVKGTENFRKKFHSAWIENN